MKNLIHWIKIQLTFSHKKEMEKMSIGFRARKAYLNARINLLIFSNPSAYNQIKRLLWECEILKAEYTLKKLKE